MAKHTLLSVPKIAREVGMSKSCLYDLIRRGEIPHLRYMRQIRVSLQDVTRWIESNFGTDYKPGKLTNAKLREARAMRKKV